MNATTAPVTVTHDTPIGALTLSASDAGLTRCTFRTVAETRVDASSTASGWLDQARRELDRYFAGDLRTFTVPVDLRRVGGLHRRVLGALGQIGYGQTITYGTLAAMVGLTDDGPREVGGAMARNPILIIVPCHRILGAGGNLTGYAGGLPAKQWLLHLERHHQAPQLDLKW
ncbi:MAG: methylated-DNA--[protein]-cysteine S-methyltransferase [Egibacteraceae bacterium]